jgi:hypothetical protein
LIDVHTLLDAKVGNNHIESLVEHANDLGWPDDRAVLRCQAVNEHAEEKVLRGVPSGLAGLSLGVALLRDLGDSLAVEVQLGLGS